MDRDHLASRSRIGGIYGFAVLLALVLFYLHVMVIFDVIGEMLRVKAWMLEHLGPKHTGKILLLVIIVQDKNNLLKINIKNTSYFEGSRITGLMLL